MGRVFLSHSSTDKPFVRRFADTLSAFGVVTFLDEKDIKLGEDIPKAIFKEISNASSFLYFISKNSIKSKWVEDELSTAKMLEKSKRGIFILPILIDEIEALPPSIVSKRYADFKNGVIEIDSDSFKLVLTALGVATEYEIERTIQLSKEPNTQAMLANILVASANLQVALSDISFLLRFAHETKSDTVSIRRLLETKNEISYRQLPIKFQSLFSELAQVRPKSMFESLIVDTDRRKKAFYDKIDEVATYKPEKRPDTKWLDECAEAARSLQRQLGRLHHMLLLFYIGRFR